ncbi:hypothetical protein TREPR_0739 [Treponema primitia ZAS-2]|uniref:Lipoprotein n=1 Tax=Treponema primitia (strain ATCC BAA-887 / DSM 12427 / ZAS-2) TaxID=545694 RepID=F5YJF0_TREPZ|nr:hypothetical protein [Treponema primitia]AEF85498.1 hypothetical protein TREPR_0739 [Treponema primitia ZAS-2]
MKKFFVLSVLMMILSTLFNGCSIDIPDPPPISAPTYFFVTGSISTRASNFRDVCNTPQEAYAYMVKYPVYPDIYRTSDSGVTREEVIETFDSNPVIAADKAIYLHLLDTRGAFFGEGISITGEHIYIYIVKE